MNFTWRQNLADDLERRYRENSLRDLDFVSSEQYVDFFSNDYLGLARNISLRTQIIKRTQELLEENSSQNSIGLFGSTGSRLLSGNHGLHRELEEKLARFYLAEAALIFSSGYMANLATISALTARGDVILFDEEIHASVKQALRLSYALSYRFRHNDIDDLKKKLQKFSSQNIFVVVESIYSMSGDIAPLVEIAALKEKFSFNLIVDEAHSNGLFGREHYGNGLCCALGIEAQVDVRVMPFGKAIGAMGAAVVSDKLIKQYLINFSLPFIYTTAMPVQQLVVLDESLDFLQKNFQKLSKSLRQNLNYYKSVVNSSGNSLNNSINNFQGKQSNDDDVSSCIEKIMVGDAKQARELAQRLHQKNIIARAIVAPTVKKGQERLRVILHSFNTFDEIKIFSEIVKENLQAAQR